MKSFFKKIQTIPVVAKFIINHYAHYQGAGITINQFGLDHYYIRVKMPLTKKIAINFLSLGRCTVYADIQLNADEIKKIKVFATNYAPVLRHYTLNIVDEAGLPIAELEKVLYIHRKKPK